MSGPHTQRMNHDGRRTVPGGAASPRRIAQRTYARVFWNRY